MAKELLLEEAPMKNKFGEILNARPGDRITPIPFELKEFANEAEKILYKEIFGEIMGGLAEGCIYTIRQILQWSGGGIVRLLLQETGEEEFYAQDFWVIGGKKL